MLRRVIFWEACLANQEHFYSWRCCWEQQVKRLNEGGKANNCQISLRKSQSAQGTQGDLHTQFQPAPNSLKSCRTQIGVNFYYLFQRIAHRKPNFGHWNARTVNLSTDAHHTRNANHLTNFPCATSTQVKPTSAFTHIHTQGINLQLAVLPAQSSDGPQSMRGIFKPPRC